jgi:hypothetical protein
MKKYTKEQLLFFLKRLNSKIKKSPTIKDINQDKDSPSANTYIKRFGSWNNALNVAGLIINIKQGYKKDELLENLRILAKELQRPPKPSDLKDKKWAGSYTTYTKYFGKWKTGIRLANLDIGNTTQNLKAYSKKKQI